MTDFWEALGRMVCDPKLAETFIGQQPKANTIDTKTIKGRVGLDIPEKHYSQIQDLFSPVLSQGILSIMAAGELYWTFSFDSPREKIKDLSRFMQREKIPLYQPSAGFFVGLGMIIIDHYLRDDIKKGVANLKHGPRLSESERSDLLRLAANPAFDALCLLFCKFPWDGSNCNSTYTLWEGHLHPVAVSEPYPEGKAKPEKAVAAHHP